MNANITKLLATQRKIVLS